MAWRPLSARSQRPQSASSSQNPTGVNAATSAAAVTSPPPASTSSTAASSAIAPAPAASSNRVQVGVRVRPLIRSDMEDARIIVTADPNDRSSVVIDALGKRGRQFAFDAVFDEKTEQQEVFETFGRPMLEEAYKGFNVCLFAYGQTGSGKTYSLMGDGQGSHAGLIPRFVREMFRTAQAKVESDPELTVKISMSFLEVYMEKIHDLLVQRSNRPQEQLESLDVHETASRKVFVKGLSSHPVLSADRVMELLAYGSANRQTAETRMNEVSSRSHAIVQFTVSQICDGVSEKRDLESIISLVDLAGSERQGKTEAIGAMFDESRNINKSLLMLGRALNSFASDRAGEFLSLRESKLTRLLSESFGGNSKTWMLATVSPAAFNASETLSTLEYANNAKCITNRATVNKLARHLEIAQLRQRHDALALSIAAERDRIAEYDQRTSAAEVENAALQAMVRKHLDNERVSAMDSLIEKQTDTNEKLRQYIDLLRQGGRGGTNGHYASGSSASSAVTSPSSSAAAAAPAPLLPRLGRCGVSLENIILAYDKTFEVPLELAEASGSALRAPLVKFALLPLRSDDAPSRGGGGDSIATSGQALRVNAAGDTAPQRQGWESVGSDVHWVLHLHSVEGLVHIRPGTDSQSGPPPTHAYCRVTLRFDTLCGFDTPVVEVGNTGVAVFDWKKRFQISRLTKQMVRHCAESSVLCIEVIHV